MDPGTKMAGLQLPAPLAKMAAGEFPAFGDYNAILQVIWRGINTVIEQVSTAFLMTQ